VKLDPKVASGPIAALVALLLISLETADAFHRAGSSKATPVARVQLDDPVADFERRLAARDPHAAGAPAIVNPRDPFRFEPEHVAVQTPARARPQAAPPPPAPMPVLTAIIWDNDPRASIRWKGRDYTVKANSQVSDYRVVLIGRDQVLLAHGGESLILKLHGKGE